MLFILYDYYGFDSSSVVNNGFSLAVKGFSLTDMGDIESIFEEKDLILTVGLSII